MAIMTLSGTGIVGAGDASTPGITHPTSGSAEKSYGTTVRAKNSEGDVVAALVGKESYSMSVTGYSTNADGPALGDEIEVAGLAGKVISVNVERSVEDFSRFTAEGRGLP
jgi:hypothetical protein